MCFKHSCFPYITVNLAFQVNLQQKFKKNLETIAFESHFKQWDEWLWVHGCICMRLSIAHVYYEPGFRLPRVNLFRGMTVNCGREENTFSHDNTVPNHTTASGLSFQVTSLQQRSGTGMKGNGIEASNFCVPHCLCLRLCNWSPCVLSSEVKWLQKQHGQTQQRQEWHEGPSQERMCQNKTKLWWWIGWFGVIHQKHTKYHRRLPLTPVHLHILPVSNKQWWSRTNTFMKLPILLKTLFVLYSPRKVTESNRKPFVQLDSGFIHGIKVNLQTSDVTSTLWEMLLQTLLHSLIQGYYLKNSWTFQSILNAAAPGGKKKKQLWKTQPQFAAFPSAGRSSISRQPQLH